MAEALTIVIYVSQSTGLDLKNQGRLFSSNRIVGNYFTILQTDGRLVTYKGVKFRKD